jgi:hypothetical protein
MLFQQLVEPRPTEPALGTSRHTARETEHDFNHSQEK